MDELPLSPANGCRRCQKDFGSLSAFDKHMAGGSCLTAAELTARGWRRDSRGRWRRAGGDNPFSTGVRREPELWSARRGPLEAA